MPKIYKVKEHDPSSNAVIYHQTSADIVDFDSSNCDNLDDVTTQGAIETVNAKVEDRATIESLNELDTKVDGCAITETFIAVIKADAFEGDNAPFRQKIMVDGILDTDNPIVGIVESNQYMSAMNEKEAWGCINRITCHPGYIIAYCYEDRPIVDITIQIKVIR